MRLLRSSFVCDCGVQMTIGHCGVYCDDVVFRCNKCWRKTFARTRIFFHLIPIDIKIDYDNCCKLDNKSASNTVCNLCNWQFSGMSTAEIYVNENDRTESVVWRIRENRMHHDYRTAECLSSLEKFLNRVKEVYPF